MSIPRALQYSSIKPRGFASSFKRWEVQPQTSYNIYNNNDIIRFIFQTQDFIDPYQSFIEMEITFDAADYTGINGQPIGEQNQSDCKPVFQLDGPSTTLISEMILYSNSKEVERITEYDQIGNLLADFGMNLDCRFSKIFEGYAHGRSPAQMQGAMQAGLQTQGNGHMLSTHGFRTVTGGAVIGDLDTTIKYSAKYGSHLHQIPPFIGEIDAVANENAGIQTQIGQYTAVYQGSAFSNQLSSQHIYLNTPYRNNKAKINYAVAQMQMDSTYGCQSANSITSGLYGAVSKFGLQGNMCSESEVVPVTQAWNYGYIRPESYGSQFNKSCQISPFAPTMTWVNGQQSTVPLGYMPSLSSTQAQFAITKKTFYIPILSGVLGTLIPADQWKLIPGEGLGQLMFEFRMNPYAFFASGHKYPANQIGVNGNPDLSQYQYAMKWKITKITMNFDLWNFGELIQQQIRQALGGEGIIITSQGFTMGPMYTVSTTSDVKNTWHINNGILSLRNVLFWFLDNRYTKYSSCRKNFKLSHNLKSMQLKIGQQWIPQQPIQGNAGQIGKNSTFNTDFTQFYVELMRSQGQLFDCGKQIQISPEQFIVNNRAYDPASFAHTFSQQSLFHENRCRGQAVFGFDLMSDPFDRSVLSGIDTTKVRPIELVLDVNKDINYPGDFMLPSTMHILLHHDILVNYKLGGVETAGFG